MGSGLPRPVGFEVLNELLSLFRSVLLLVQVFTKVFQMTASGQHLTHGATCVGVVLGTGQTYGYNTRRSKEHEPSDPGSTLRASQGQITSQRN